MKEEEKTKIFIALILLIGVFPGLGFILVWFIKNVMTPIGQVEDLAWALSSPNPWDWVLRLAILIIIGSITTIVIAWIREKIRL